MSKNDRSAAPCARHCSCGADLYGNEAWPVGDDLLCQMCWESYCGDKFWEMAVSDLQCCGEGIIELRQAVSILFEVASELMSLAQTEGVVQSREVHDALMKRGQTIAFRAKQIDGIVAKYPLSGRK